MWRTWAHGPPSRPPSTRPRSSPCSAPCPRMWSPSTWPSSMSMSWADPSTGGGECAVPERPGDLAPSFVIARNPEEDSRLGYLVRLPVEGGEMVLKAADTWPRTKALYCHPADWPDVPEIVETVPVRTCHRRGVAIDLVLERPRENRAQFVFTTARGRDVIFWQSPKTTARSRPGVRVPTRRASGFEELTILIDTRERYPYRVARQQATTQRRVLPAGDYGVAHHDEIVAVVECKSLDDLVAGSSTATSPTRLPSSSPSNAPPLWSRSATRLCSRSIA